MAILTPGNAISVEMIPLEIRTQDAVAPSSPHEARDEAERGQFLRALESSHWNVSRAARSLGTERTNLHKRMRALGIRR